MGVLKQYVDKIDACLQHKSVDPYFSRIEKTVPIPRKYLATAVIGLLGIAVFIGYVNQLIVILGFLYPAYKSIKAIESSDVADDRRWLIYWVVYSTLIIAEYFSDWLLFWIPFYYMFKSCLLIWCMHPNYNGSMVIYNNLIRPAFIAHEKKIDKVLNNVQNNGTGVLNKLVNEVGELGQEIGSEVANNAELKEKMAEGLVKASMALNNAVNSSSSVNKNDTADLMEEQLINLSENDKDK